MMNLQESFDKWLHETSYDPMEIYRCTNNSFRKAFSLYVNKVPIVTDYRMSKLSLQSAYDNWRKETGNKTLLINWENNYWTGKTWVDYVDPTIQEFSQFVGFEGVIDSGRFFELEVDYRQRNKIEPDKKKHLEHIKNKWQIRKTDYGLEIESYVRIADLQSLFGQFSSKRMSPNARSWEISERERQVIGKLKAKYGNINIVYSSAQMNDGIIFMIFEYSPENAKEKKQEKRVIATIERAIGVGAKIIIFK